MKHPNIQFVTHIPGGTEDLNLLSASGKHSQYCWKAPALGLPLSE
jgi:hypothetical protein